MLSTLKLGWFMWHWLTFPFNWWATLAKRLCWHLTIQYLMRYIFIWLFRAHFLKLCGSKVGLVFRRQWKFVLIPGRKSPILVNMNSQLTFSFLFASEKLLLKTTELMFFQQFFLLNWKPAEMFVKTITTPNIERCFTWRHPHCHGPVEKGCTVLMLYTRYYAISFGDSVCMWHHKLLVTTIKWMWTDLYILNEVSQPIN